MTAPSIAEIDTLNSLLEAEVNSICHFMGEDSPFLTTASPQVRQTLMQLLVNLRQHEVELANLIRRLGGRPANPPKPDAEEQYLSFLSPKFLLPKLVDAKQLMIDRYDHALAVVKDNPTIVALLEKHIKEMREDLATLKSIATEIHKSH